LVLAAGEGSRLRSMTTDLHGVTVPKQFCSLVGGPSLLRLALSRAAQASPWARITTIVAQHHEPWWKGQLGFLPSSNIIVQPRNRGTALGILFPLLRILTRDPMAHLVVLPSDHFVADELVLDHSIQMALAEIEQRPGTTVLLGIVPHEADPQFGWIVPSEGKTSCTREVARFVEKPPVQIAEQLMELGAVWNSFILVAAGSSILRLFERKLPVVTETLRVALHRSAPPEALQRAYAEIDCFDFCKDVLEGLEPMLRVLPVPHCGWSDLGTPDRVRSCLRGVQFDARQAGSVQFYRPPGRNHLHRPAPHAEHVLA
jgi:mannose-1-phosphate guanylyltransferase